MAWSVISESLPLAEGLLLSNGAEGVSETGQ